MKIALSQLVAGRQNPRRVKPEREAHKRLVASIEAHGLLEPLVVRPNGDDKYHVIAGNRRLTALREVHRGEDVKVECATKRVDEDTASAMSLAENFAREPMHPLDEAEAFARLASDKCKGVPAIAEEFGVSETYVRQRMKLAGLAEVVKTAFRRGEIGVGVAEAFAAVPEDRQKELWKETGGKPRHAQHVRNLIEHRWIPATHAAFDVASLDSGVVSHDLFGGNVLVERTAFMQAQASALEAERGRLLEDGWKDAVIAQREQVQDRLYAMDEATPDYPAPVQRKLAKIAETRAKLERAPAKDEAAEDRIAGLLTKLDEREQAILKDATGSYGEATKASGTVFLMLSPDGRIERRYRLPRAAARENGEHPHGGGSGTREPGQLPTSDALTDRQQSALHHHKALAVREAVAGNRLVQKRLFVLALHEKVMHDAIAVRRDVNGTVTVAGQQESVRSPLHDAQQGRLAKIDPLKGEARVDEAEAYAKLARLSEKKLDALIAVLIVEAMTGHGGRATPLIDVLAAELGVSLRTHWTPDADWLSGYTKAQLAHLAGTLRPGAVNAAMGRKKSELVAELAGVFEKAASDPKHFADKEFAERVNAWKPKVTGEAAPNAA